MSAKTTADVVLNDVAYTVTVQQIGVGEEVTVSITPKVTHVNYYLLVTVDSVQASEGQNYVTRTAYYAALRAADTAIMRLEASLTAFLWEIPVPVSLIGNQTSDLMDERHTFMREWLMRNRGAVHPVEARGPFGLVEAGRAMEMFGHEYTVSSVAASARTGRQTICLDSRGLSKTTAVVDMPYVAPIAVTYP